MFKSFGLKLSAISEVFSSLVTAMFSTKRERCDVKIYADLN